MAKRRRKKKKYLKFNIIIYLLIIVMLIVGVVFFLQTDYFNVDEIVVTGSSVSSDEEIIARSGVTKGSNIFSFSFSQGKKEIEKMLYIKSVNIVRKYPSKVEIIVEERKPDYIVQVGLAYYDIDEDGIILEENSKLNRYDTIVITGLALTKPKVGASIYNDDTNLKAKTVQALIFSLKENNIIGEISEIYISNEKMYFLYLNKGSIIKFRNYTAYEDNIKFIQYFIKNQNEKVVVELIEGANPIYSSIE